MTPRSLVPVVAGVLVTVTVSAGSSRGAPAPFRQYVTRPDLKPTIVEVLKRTPRAKPGYIFIAPKENVIQTGPMILNNRGEVVWFLPVDTAAIANFRVQRYLGRPVLTWWRGRRSDGEGVGRHAIYNTSYRPVAFVRPVNVGGDFHDFVITKRNTALMTITYHYFQRGRRILGGGLQEVDIKTGRLLFEWRSKDHVELSESYYRLPRDPSKTFDYFHVNSIEVDHDGNLLVSARNTHTIYKISRRTGKVLWRLGGKRSDFSLGRDVRFAWQHDARRRPDGTLTLFDNSAGPKVRPQSRGLVLRLDVRRMHATVVRSFVHRPSLVSVDQANMQPLPSGHFLIGWGHKPYVTEFDGRGRIVLDLRFGKGRVDSYRAYRFDWTGRPTRAPAVAVRGKKLYVSWNGATEVNTWQLLAGARRESLRAVRTVRRSGFETAIPLPRSATWVAVRALDGRERPIGRSAAVRGT